MEMALQVKEFQTFWNLKYRSEGFIVKAYLLLSTNFNKIPLKKIETIQSNTIVILTEKYLYEEFMIKYPNVRTAFIDLFSDINSKDASILTSYFLEDLLKEYPNFQWKDYELTEILVNQLFSPIEIIYNLIRGIDDILKKYKITSLILFGGSSKKQFFPLTLSEGERAFRFLYRREWFLNYFVYTEFNNKVLIEWNNRIPSVLLNCISYSRPLVILFGKFFALVNRLLKNRILIGKNTQVDENKQIAVFLVRNPIQVEPLLPLYNEFKKRGKYSPLFLSFENYSNNKLVSKLDDMNVNYVDLLSNMTFKQIFNSLKEVFRITRSRNKQKHSNYLIGDFNFRFSYSEIARNFSPFILDIILVVDQLESFFEGKNEVCCLINNETHGYHSAIQANWVKKKGKMSYGVQHVAIANRYKPRISRVSTMFMMSDYIAKQLSEIKPDEKFLFLGPMSYDQHFNTTQHRNGLKTLSIFTQPDDFKNEYIQIIEQVLNIVSNHGLNLEINIKLHPRESDYESYNRIIRNNDKANILGKDYSSNELIKQSDLVISIHSGVLMQSIIIGTPSISVNFGMKHNIKFDFINHDVTKKITTNEELKFCLLNFECLNNDYKSNRLEYLKSYLNNYDGHAASKAYDYISKDIKTNCTCKEG